MLSVLLKCLCILGIVLLCLLGLLIILLVLVLFFPVKYRFLGEKNTQEMCLDVRAHWLFGLLRVRYALPEPGKLLVKLLWFTLFDSEKAAAESGKKHRKSKKKGAAEQGRKQPENGRESEAAGRETQGNRESTQQNAAAGREVQENAVESRKAGESTAENRESTAEGRDTQNGSMPVDRENAQNSQEARSDDNSKSFSIFEKIKYTILNIYDKIKKIWENIIRIYGDIEYYANLLRDEDTKLLFSHAMFRLGRVLKSIRPRKIRADILFGTGSPDTTGYAYGVYGMLSPFLGQKVLVTPDFTRAVLEGEFYAAGHITAFTILWNGLRLLLDRRLRLFIKKLKAGRKK